jgi:hypothetical protein
MTAGVFIYLRYYEYPRSVKQAGDDGADGCRQAEILLPLRSLNRPFQDRPRATTTTATAASPPSAIRSKWRHLNALLNEITRNAGLPRKVALSVLTPVQHLHCRSGTRHGTTRDECR